MRAQSVIDVMLGEGVSGPIDARYSDLEAIASAIANRANALGVSPQSVVSNRREFNAYGKSLPAGVNAYRGLAQQAWDNVMQNGPTHTGSFYATPRAAKNLPRGLEAVATTKGHQFFSDPYARSINTAQGYRKPSMEAQQQLADLAGVSIPTPMDKPSASFSAPAPASVQRGLLGDVQAQAAPTGGLLSAGFDTSRFAGPSVSNFDNARFAGPMEMANAGLLGTTGRVSSTAAFDPGRFAAPEKIANSSGMLASMLNRQRETALPKMDSEEAMAALSQPAPQSGYVDPYVTTQDVPTTVTAQAPTYTPTAPVEAYVAQETPPAVDAINTAATPAGLPAAPKQNLLDQKIGGLLGTLGPAAIGGILGGLPGALAGGLLGKTVFGGKNGFPSKPSKNSGPKAPSMSKGEIDAMHDRASKSPQARGAWSNGSSGLF